MKKKLLLPIMLLFTMVSLLLVGCDQQPALTYVTVDINPSIDFVVNSENNVEGVAAMNQDGELLLLNLSLQNKSVDDAIEEVIDEAIDLGFIDPDAEETIVNVNATSSKVQARFEEKINLAFQERGMFGRAVKQDNQELQTEAEELGVEVGFLRLVYRAIEANDELTKEVALTMTTEELITIVHQNNQQLRQLLFQQRTEFFEDRQAILDTYLPQIQALEDEIALMVENNEDTTEKEAELAALKETMRTELTALRSEFQLASEEIKTQLQTMNQARIQEHLQQVNQFKNQMQERKNQYQDQIKEYQKTGEKPEDKGTNGKTE